MNPFRAFLNLFRRGEDPQRQVRYVLPYQVSGLNLTPDETLSLAAVWACIDVISSAVSSCRWSVFEPVAPRRRRRLDEDPLTWILNTRPNPEMTAIGFREAMLFQAIPFGNSYAEIVRDGAGRIAQLWPLPSDRVRPMRDENWRLVYQHLEADGTTTILQSKDVFHLRGPGLYGLMGENVVARAAKSISVAAAQERYAASFFGQGAQPGGVLEWPTKLDKDTADRLKADWAEKRKGPENAHKPIILEAGMKWTATAIDPQKSQAVEARQFSVEEICRWFHVPPHKVQHLLHATFSNIEHSSIEFVRDALTPWARRLDQEADFKLLRQDRAPWRYTCIDLRPLSAGDFASRATAYASGRQNGWLTANEIRELEGFDDCGDDGDVLLVQSNLTTVERIMNPPAPPALGPGTAPAPGEDGGGEPDEDLDPDVDPVDEELAEPETDADAATARQALTIVLAMTLERYARKLANRRSEMQKRGVHPEQVAAQLAQVRAGMWPRLLAELAPASVFAERVLGRRLELADLQAAARFVDAGDAPAAAAARALPASCPRSG